MRIAAVSDIHGNLLALDAVMADIATRSVDVVVNLGDLVSGGLQPAETADRLITLELPTVRGNHERQLLTTPVERMSASDRLAHTSLRPEQLEETGARAATLDEVVERLGDTAEWPQLLCGHTHLQRELRPRSGTLVVNPASVGWPAYADDDPYPHVMEAGSPHARYAVFDDASGRWEGSLTPSTTTGLERRSWPSATTAPTSHSRCGRVAAARRPP